MEADGAGLARSHGATVADRAAANMQGSNASLRGTHAPNLASGSVPPDTDAFPPNNKPIPSRNDSGIPGRSHPRAYANAALWEPSAAPHVWHAPGSGLPPGDRERHVVAERGHAKGAPTASGSHAGQRDARARQVGDAAGGAVSRGTNPGKKGGKGGKNDGEEVVVDVGAMYIHGVDDEPPVNPVYAFSRKLGLDLVLPAYDGTSYRLVYDK